MEYLNDKPTAIIRKASSIHNSEFNLIRHPANFITYLTGLLIQFMLLLFQITALGPTSVGNALEDAFGNAAAPSPLTLGTSPGTEALPHIRFYTFLFLPACREVQTRSRRKKGQENPNRKSRFIIVNACARQSKQQPPT